jgi:hypothetical protein
LVVAALLIGGSFAAGYLKGAMSCKSINVSKAQKSLELSQAASRSTAKFNLEQQQKTVQAQQTVKEIDHECLPTTMPPSLIDALNQ